MFQFLYTGEGQIDISIILFSHTGIKRVALWSLCDPDW